MSQKGNKIWEMLQELKRKYAAVEMDNEQLRQHLAAEQAKSAELEKMVRDAQQPINNKLPDFLFEHQVKNRANPIKEIIDKLAYGYDQYNEIVGIMANYEDMISHEGTVAEFVNKKIDEQQATIAAMRSSLENIREAIEVEDIYEISQEVKKALSNTAGAEYAERVKKLEQVADDACAIMDELARGDAPSEAAYEALRESLDLVGWDADNKGNSQTQRLRKLEEAAQAVCKSKADATEFSELHNRVLFNMSKDKGALHRAIDNLQAVLGEGKA